MLKICSFKLGIQHIPILVDLVNQQKKVDKGYRNFHKRRG